MKKAQLLILVIVIISSLGVWFWIRTVSSEVISLETEAEFEMVNTDQNFITNRLYQKFPELKNWERPEGPLRVGLQAGHWLNSELPDELERLRGTSVGTSGGGKKEWEVNLEIVQATAKLLEEKGIIVDILPATVPPAYFADVFIAIHADGNKNTNISGFKVASTYACLPSSYSGGWQGRQGSNHSQRSFRLGNNCPQSTEVSRFVELLEKEYQQATNLGIDQNISHNMRGYYAFNWWRNDHSVHPMTVAAILETGFLTSPKDQKVLINKQELAAQGIANAVFKFLNI